MKNFKSKVAALFLSAFMALGIGVVAGVSAKTPVEANAGTSFTEITSLDGITSGSSYLITANFNGTSGVEYYPVVTASALAAGGVSVAAKTTVTTSTPLLTFTGSAGVYTLSVSTAPTLFLGANATNNGILTQTTSTNWTLAYVTGKGFTCTAVDSASVTRYLTLYGTSTAASNWRGYKTIYDYGVSNSYLHIYSVAESSAYASSVAVSGTASITEGLKGFANTSLTATVTYSDASTDHSATWSVTDSDTYSASSSSSNASINSSGVLTFNYNGTVYVWATSIAAGSDGSTLVHNASGYAVTASNLEDNEVINGAVVGATSTTYVDFTNVKINTATYSGNANAYTGVSPYGIGFRVPTNANSGLVTTATGGLLKKILFNVEYIGSGATLSLYLSNTAYTSVSDLNTAITAGTVTPTTTVSTLGMTTYTVSGNYQFFALIASGSFTLYNIGVVWEDVLPTSITANPASVAVSVSGTQAVTLTFVNSSGLIVSNTKVTWGSNDYSVASVTDGTITGVAGGSTTVTAVSKGDATVYVSIPVTVSTGTIPVTGITISPTELNLYASQTGSLTATVAPSNATNKNVTWSSDTPAAATVDSSTGVVTAVAEGTATITATASDGSGVTATAAVYVSAFDYSIASSLNGGDKVIITGTTNAVYLGDIAAGTTTYGAEVAYTDKPYSAVSTYVYSVVAGSATGSVAFKNAAGKYISWTSGNALALADSISANSSWTVSFDASNIATVANVADSTRLIRDNHSSTRFAAYASTTGTLVQIWKLGYTSGSQSYAETFANSFNSALLGSGSYCDPEGVSTVTSDVSDAWTLLASDYANLLDSVKAYIAAKDGHADSSDVVEKMLAQYNFIYTKYGTSLSLTNFMERKEANKSAVTPESITENNNTEGTIAAIVIVSLIGVTAVGGYFFIRKRREEN